VTLLSDQITRIRDLLQDTDTSPARQSILITAHQEAMQRLARQGHFPQILWVNAVAGQALYTLPTSVVTISHVLYNECVLRFASEAALDRRAHGWEAASAVPTDPTYWTTDNQAPQVIRLVPAPVRTGSLVPATPPSPLIGDMRDNLVIFHTEDVSVDLVNAGDTLPTLLDWDDLLVWQTTKQLAERETHDQNRPVAALCRQLEMLWTRYMPPG